MGIVSKEPVVLCYCYCYIEVKLNFKLDFFSTENTILCILHF